LTLPSAEQAAVSSAAELLRGAKRPLVIIGKGVRWSAPFDELRQLVENWQMPFITSPMGQGVLPDDHPLCFNVMRTTVQSSCDLVLVLGARLDWTFRYGAELAPDARLIHVDIDPRAHGNTVEPKVALLGDVKVVMQQLLKEMGLPVAREIGGSSWLRTLQEQRRTQLKLLTADMEHDREGPISAQVLVAELKQAIPEDAICVLDGNLILAAAQDGLSSHLPASRFTPGSNGCIGVGVPFGIGAKLSSPQRPVVVICGDTAFSISAMEMETAVRHDIPLVVVVANNDGISGTIKQHTHFPPGHERVTMFMPGIRYEQMVEISGGHGEYVDHVDQVRPAMERALASGLPACVHVRVSS
jgi:2-hydroxyacyl-CoA lyase 1